MQLWILAFLSVIAAGCKTSNSKIQNQNLADTVTCSLTDSNIKITENFNLQKANVSCRYADQQQEGVIADRNQVEALSEWMLVSQSTSAGSGNGSVVVQEPLDRQWASFPKELLESDAKNINIASDKVNDIDMKSVTLTGVVKKNGYIGILCLGPNNPSPLCPNTPNAYTVRWPVSDSAAQNTNIECTFVGSCSRKVGRGYYALAKCQSGGQTINACVVGTTQSKTDFIVDWKTPPDQYVYSFALKSPAGTTSFSENSAQCGDRVAPNQEASSIGCSVKGFSAKSVTFADGSREC